VDAPRWNLIELPTHRDERGALTVIESPVIPFEIRRTYHIHAVPQGVARGGHAHRALSQVIVAVHGRFDAIVDDGHNDATVRLDRPDVGLHLAGMVWLELREFSPDAVCLVLASEPYTAKNRIDDLDSFRAEVRAR
jgi:dTDP-4-dehydrorhamnose 3,5-epimerase-like enzyme